MDCIAFLGQGLAQSDSRPAVCRNRPIDRYGFARQLRHVPDLDRVIAASRDQAPAVGAERHAADEAGVAAEAADQRTGVAVPDLHGAVLTRRGDPPASGSGLKATA